MPDPPPALQLTKLCENSLVRYVLPMGKDAFIGRDIGGGRYTVLRCIGRGGMGSVYVARQEWMERDVALKVLHPEIANNSVAVQRFFREARAAGRLTHSNTITIHDLGRCEDGTLYIAMELLRGKPLSHLLQSGPLSPLRVISIGIQVCRSLAEAHSLHLVHRDLKPDNIFIADELGRNDMVKVLDFGIVKLLRAPGLLHLTKTGTTIGTPGYMSPEAAMSKPIGPGSDLYSLGIVLYEALTGRPLYTSRSAVELIMKHVNDPIPPMNVANPSVKVPHALEQVVRKMLEKQPRHRYRSAAGAIGALLACLPEGTDRLLEFADTEPILEVADDDPTVRAPHPEFAATLPAFGDE